MNQRIVRTSLVLGASAFGAYALLVALVNVIDWHPRFFLNFSPSAPIGLWKHETIGNDPWSALDTGQWTVICPPIDEIMHEALFLQPAPEREGENCISRLMLKRVAALPGDEVTVVGETVTTPIGSVLSIAEQRGIELPRPTQGTHHVTPETIWVINDYHERSIDSRYFGPVAFSAIRSTAKPLITVD